MAARSYSSSVVAEQEDWSADAGLAQGDCFVDGGNGEAVCAGLQGGGGDQVGSVAVGVRFDDGVEQTARPDEAAKFGDIRCEG